MSLLKYNILFKTNQKKLKMGTCGKLALHAELSSIGFLGGRVVTPLLDTVHVVWLLLQCVECERKATAAAAAAAVPCVKVQCTKITNINDQISHYNPLTFVIWGVISLISIYILQWHQLYNTQRKGK